MTVWGNGTKTKPRVSSKYGPRKGGAFSFHYGTDFTGYTDLHAILGGVVTQVGRMNDAAGNVIVIDSKLPDGRTVTIVRMHAASWTVKRGDHVTEGQVIGRMGSTGNATGLCDHVEVRFWDNGKLSRVDPEVWIADMLAAPSIVKHITVDRSVADVQRVVGATPDGIWGPKTDAAVRAFQSRHGLTVDGIWGPKSDAAGFPKPATPAPSGPVTYRSIQAGLNKFGYGLKVDGIWGPKSSNALADFQRKHGLKADRIVGPKTRAALGI